MAPDGAFAVSGPATVGASSPHAESKAADAITTDFAMRLIERLKLECTGPFRLTFLLSACRGARVLVQAGDRPGARGREDFVARRVMLHHYSLCNGVCIPLGLQDVPGQVWESD